MSDIRYTKEHEWVRAEGGTATVGISEHAQEQLGDVVFVELPEVGRVVSQNAAMAVVESVKAASDVYAPISGEVVEVNDALSNDPALVNSDADAFLQAATHAPQPMHAAASNAASASSFGTRISLASGALPVPTDTYPPAAMMRSKALRSVTRSFRTGNDLARNGSTVIVAPLGKWRM